MVKLVSLVLVESLTAGKTILGSLKTSKGMNVENHVIRLTSGNCETLAKQGARILVEGGLIGTPTDTIYGIAADAQNNQAVNKIYEIKGRDFKKPIAICVSDISQVYTWGKVTVPHTLLQDLFPGPVTLVFERFAALNPNLNPHINLIGIRIPNNEFILNLAKFHGGPVALTSANKSSEPSTLSVDEFKPLWPHIDCVFDGGCLSKDEKTTEAARAGSTVIDLSSMGSYRIIREGTHREHCTHILRDKYGLAEKLEN